jgi:hypothetical protein
MPPSTWFSVLGNDYRVSVDDPGLRTVLTTLFGRFVSDAPSPTLTEDDPAPRHLVIRTGQSPAVVLDRVARPLTPDAATQQAFIVLNETFLREARGCRVLHAAALTARDRVVLVAGPSTYGKSTLALLLLERGLGFLGDDFAPLDMASGRILPFPKTIGIRPRVEELLSPLTRSRLDAASERRLGDKRLVDVEELFPGQLARAARVGMVVLLSPPEDSTETQRQVLLIGALGEVPELAEALEPFGELEGPLQDFEGPLCAYRLNRRADGGFSFADVDSSVVQLD